MAPSLVRHFKLLRLAPEIRCYLAALRDPKAVYFFSLRRLMPLATLPEEEQPRQVRRMAARIRVPVKRPCVDCRDGTVSWETAWRDYSYLLGFFHHAGITKRRSVLRQTRHDLLETGKRCIGGSRREVGARGWLTAGRL